MSVSSLLVRPKPISGESLSSWRQRVGWANGFRLFPVPDERTRRADPDIGYDERDFEWVATLHQSTNSIARGMTFRAYVGIIDESVGPRSHPQWWLRARYGLNAKSFGPMFCPHCLGADLIPFFRLEWRFGFHTACRRHLCLLLDQCPQCLKPPWPSGCGTPANVHPKFQSLLYCWHCAMDLSMAPTRSVDCTFDLYAQLDGDYPNISLAGFSTADVLKATRSVCQIFMRTRATHVIAKSSSIWSHISSQLVERVSKENSVEYLDVSTRHLLVQSALQILENWPESFLKFANEAGISRTHFNDSLHMAPSWMSDCITTRLARQNRTVTNASLKDAYRALVLNLGRPPTKAEVRRHLNWQGEKGLDELFPKSF